MSGLHLLLLLGAAFAQDDKQIYPNRWVYVSRGLGADSDVADIRAIAETGAQHGLNGMVLAAGLDRLDLQNQAYFRRLREVKEILDANAIELIPIIFSAGYGGSVISHNRNLAEGLAVKDAPFRVRNQEARLETDPAVALVNSGFEDYSGNTARAYAFHDRPGEVSFVDNEVMHSGRASLRFENFERFPNGNARVMQEIKVQPYRCYRVTVWVKTENLRGSLRVQVLSTSGRTMAPVTFSVPASAEWRKLTLGVNSGKEDRLRIYAGVWAGQGGRFWVDDLEIEETGLTNIVRRPGAPLVVSSADRDMTFEEGVDFEPVRDPTLTFRFDHEVPPIRLRTGTRIQDGEALRVSYYHGVAVNDGQVSICMSEEAVYEIWATQARLLHELLTPKRYLLSMDEVRAGGTDESCRRREISMAQILGSAITRQTEILRAVNPEAEIMVWSDMLDPNHNAVADYYLVEGDYSGSWQYIPNDLVIMCWYYARRQASLQHFSSLGFRTFAAAYYDGNDLSNPAGWLSALDQTPGAAGIMYTTWENKYQLLAGFGDLVSKR